MRIGIDFARPSRQPAIGWVLFVLGASTLAAALWQANRWHAEEEQRQRAHADARDLQRQEAKNQQRLKLQVALEPQTLARLRRAATELAWPWDAVLSGVEGARADPVQLVSLAIDPSSGRLRLDGEAERFEDVLSYVNRLDQSGAIQQVELVSHELLAAPHEGGRTAVRFGLAAMGRLP